MATYEGAPQVDRHLLVPLGDGGSPHRRLRMDDGRVVDQDVYPSPTVGNLSDRLLHLSLSGDIHSPAVRQSSGIPNLRCHLLQAFYVPTG